jgi:uncharacterized protein (DUF1697 family)
MPANAVLYGCGMYQPGGGMSDGRYIALLRGINVGRAKRVAMADLRALVEGLGYSEVRTLLNSGNVVFTASKTTDGRAASAIEEAITEQLGISSRVTLLNAAELAGVVKDNPLLDIADNPSRLLVALPTSKSDTTLLTPLLKEKWGAEVLALGERAAYIWSPGGISESRMAEAVARILGDGVTSRNWTTIQKLHALAMEGN